MDAVTPTVTGPLFIGDAEPGLTYYAGVARVRATWQVTANCQHRHRTRETAERCGERIAEDMCELASALTEGS